MELLEYDSGDRVPNRARKPSVIALHSSGAASWEWQILDSYIGERFSLITPNLIGNDGGERWPGTHEFKLSDEAAPIVNSIDAVEGPVHLVGHSYGGAVALRCAVERPYKIASLTLYEPAAFHVLKTIPDGKAALADIDVVAHEVSRNVLTGAYRAAARRFVDWANGEGSWRAMKAETQASLARYIPKVCLEYNAQRNERTPLVAYRRLNCPSLLLQGENSLEALQMISQKLATTMRLASIQTAYGAAHMGPITHGTAVAAMIAKHVIAAESRLERSISDDLAPGRAA